MTRASDTALAGLRTALRLARYEQRRFAALADATGDDAERHVLEANACGADAVVALLEAAVRRRTKRAGCGAKGATRR